MTRRRRLRRVVSPPGFRGYKPYGVVKTTRDYVELLYEEYEAIKLVDYEFMNHESAAKLMGVSRSTFARIYESARRKIANALVETKEIKTVYGNVIMNENWFICDNCHVKFTIPKKIKNNTCLLCASDKIKPLKN